MFYRQDPYSWDPYSNHIFGITPNPYPSTNYPNHFMLSSISPFANSQQHSGLGNLPYSPMPALMQPPLFPAQAYSHKPIQPPMNSLVSYFHDKDGNLDLNKMLSTVGQVSNTIKQVSPLFKQFGTFLGKV